MLFFIVLYGCKIWSLILMEKRKLRTSQTLFACGLFNDAVSSWDYSVEWQGDWWIVKWKRYGRKWSWPNLDTVTVLVWGNWEIPRKSPPPSERTSGFQCGSAIALAAMLSTILIKERKVADYFFFKFLCVCVLCLWPHVSVLRHINTSFLHICVQHSLVY
jgi:hypothetical protein